jgi:dTMP kinase
VSGCFISFEGGEGAGKTTQIQRLAARVRSMGFTVRELREPGGTPLGEKIRHLLKHDPDGRGMASETELLLMNASRAELVRSVIRPALNADEIVLCDRFYDSTVAYQGFGRGLDLDAVRSVIDLAVGATRPNLTLFLHVPPDFARGRVADRRPEVAGIDRFEAEQEVFFKRVADGFQRIAETEPGRFVTVDGTGPADVVAERVWNLVSPHLPKRPRVSDRL